MDTFVQTAHRLNYTEPGSATLSSGDVVVMGDMLGIVVADIAISGTGVLELDGVHDLAATSADIWSQGDQLYWDQSNEALTNVASAFIRAGIAAEDKGSTVVLAQVCLNLNSSAEGFVVYDATSLAAAVAGATATNNRILLRPGEYTLTETLALPLGFAVSILGLAGQQGATINAAAAVTPLISIVPTAAVTTFYVIENVFIDNSETSQIGIQIDNVNFTGGGAAKVYLKLKNVEMGSGGTCIDVDHDYATSAIRVNIDSSYIEGAITFDIGHSGDRLKVGNSIMEGLCTAEGDDVASTFEYWNCKSMANGAAFAGGQSTNKCVCLNCFTSADAALATGDIGGSFAETIVGAS